mmetsp:Transcript_26107/g.85859  ORF Transcript_26107/g.85859 Transcript_26107/m.85859 type:complete len:176 (-) Transcript_26107:508-1035(-)
MQLLSISISTGIDGAGASSSSLTTIARDDTSSSLKEAEQDLFENTDLSDIFLCIALGHSLRGTESLLRLCSADIIEHSLAPAVRQGYWEARQAAGLVTPSQRKCVLSWPETYCLPPLLSPCVRPTLRVRGNSCDQEVRSFGKTPFPTVVQLPKDIQCSTKILRSITWPAGGKELD